MLLEGIQSKTLSKIRANAGDKPTSGVAAETKLKTIYKQIRLNHPILSEHGVFYPQAIFNDLMFEVTLVPVMQVVKDSDATKLKYKLKNIQLEYMIRNKELVVHARRVYIAGKEFAYDHLQREEVITFGKNTDARLNIKVNPQRRPLKGILLLFQEAYTTGQTDTEKFVNPDLTKFSVTVNGSPNRLYNNGMESRDMWHEASRYFVKASDRNQKQYMDVTKFYTDNKFGVFVDLGSMPDQKMHGSGTRLVNTKGGVMLEIERETSGSGNLQCHVFTISDLQMNIMGQQVESVQY